MQALMILAIYKPPARKRLLNFCFKYFVQILCVSAIGNQIVQCMLMFTPDQELRNVVT